MKLFNKNDSVRKKERELYQHRQEQKIKSALRESDKRIIGNSKDTPDWEWWKPATYAISFGGCFLIILSLQGLAMSTHNLSKNNEKVGFFYNSGLWMYFIIFALIFIPIVFAIFKKKLYSIWYNNNIKFMNDDIDTYDNDSYLRTMDDITRDFDVAPDASLQFDGHASTIIGHAMVSNKGINKIMMPVYDKDVDGQIKRDEFGNIIYKKMPMFDEDFAHTLFDFSNVPHKYRTFYNMTEYEFNPIVPKKEGGDGKRRSGAFDRMKYDKVSDVINNEFKVLPYFTQRPAGVYFYDKRPVNTILIAITRAGKGQTFIEPSLDVWMREKNRWNWLVTDPKGELISKFYYPCTAVGMEVVQFNLLTPALTNVFNPLINAILQFRQDDDVKGTALIDSIVEVLFPDNGEIWNKAAGNMFRRAVYTLFDYTIEQEMYIRHLAYKNNVPQEIVDAEIDKLYSKVTLYNVYVLIGDLASKISKDGNIINLNPELAPVAEKDLLSVLFDAISLLPRNKLRSLAIQANNAIKPIATAPQTLAGIYASLLTGLSIYADPTTIALMSGSISESFDVSGLAFPRRFAIQLNQEFMRKYELVDEEAIWSFYRDPNFTDRYEGEDFEHVEKIKVSNWIWCYWKGILEKDVSYVKLELRSKGMEVETFYFKFVKGYKKINSVTYLINEITKQKTVSGGTLIEIEKGSGEEKIRTFSHKTIDYQYKTYSETQLPVIVSNQVFYSEKEKAIFVIVPPHLQHYQKHPLMMIQQITNEIYSLSYSTKPNGKPIVGTRFLFDEFGNIRNGDSGIPNIDTITSIALGQDIQITFVLQSFQQLRSVYGEDIEKIIRANSANIIFLKSNDKDLIEELVRLSGVKHDLRTKGMNYQRKTSDIITVAEPTLSLSRDLQETTALTTNDLLFLAGKSPGNSLTFISNEMPILNQLSTITPMAAGLHQKLPQPKRGKYSQNNLPTSKTTGSMNFLDNVIDGDKLVKDRIEQAKIAMEIQKELKELFATYGVVINETNGELSNYMMNIVYEKFDKESENIRVSLSQLKSYNEIAKELTEFKNTLISDNNSQNVKVEIADKLRKLLIDLADDDNLTKLTSLYKDKPVNNVIGYDIHSVFKFIYAMKVAYPEKAPIADLEIRDVNTEAQKSEAYRNKKEVVLDLPFDIKNTYHTSALDELVFESWENNKNVLGIQVVDQDNAATNIIIDGQKVGTIETINNMDVIDYSMERVKLSKLIENNVALFERIQRRLKEETYR